LGALPKNTNIGRVYQDWRKPEKALEYYQQAINSFKDLKDERSISIVKENVDSLNITQQT
jgi:tetratricopeptide (TPR) repeat protein